jgi:hypothetical protein
MKKQYTMSDCMAAIHEYGRRQYQTGQAKAYKDCSDIIHDWCDELESSIMGCKVEDAFFVSKNMYDCLLDIAEQFEQLSAIVDK